MRTLLPDNLMKNKILKLIFKFSQTNFSTDNLGDERGIFIILHNYKRYLLPIFNGRSKHKNTLV